MVTLLHFSIVTLGYSVAAIGAGIMLIALVILAEFALPENLD